ncbi:MAG: DUF2007 domain-containing protein [Nitrospirota bacterium]|jgi:hypothetical protein
MWRDEGHRPEEEEWVEVFATTDPVEGEILKDLLESGGIPVRTRSLRVGPYPVNVGRMGEIKILVRRHDRPSAEQAIEEFRKNARLEEETTRREEPPQ